MAGKGPIIKAHIGLQAGQGLMPVKTREGGEWEPIPHHDSCFQDAAREQALAAARLTDILEAAGVDA